MQFVVHPPNGNIVCVSNFDNGANSDIYISCIQPDGSLAWGQTCSNSCPINDDWGEDLVIDAVGNIYICGVVNNSLNQDYFIAKYAPSGSMLWSQTFDNGGDDNAVAIALDSQNNVYTTGTCQIDVQQLNTDMVTLKLDGTNGNILWTKFYDFNNLPELGVDIEIDNSGNVIVCGSSAQNYVDARFTVIKYSANTGNQLDIKRHNSPGAGYDLPSEMVLKNGNIYVVGTSNMNQQNSDVKILSLNNQLNVNWVQYLDLYGNEKDFGNALALTSNNDVAITGYTENIYGGQDFTTFLVSNTGSLMWFRIKNGDNEFSDAQGKDIIVDANDNILVTGFVEKDGLNKYRTASYDLNGTVLWERIFTLPNKNSRGGRILKSTDGIFVTGDVSDNTQRTFTSVRYDVKKRSENFEVTNLGEPLHMSNHLIIKVDPNLINTTEVDNLDKQFWSLEEIVEPSFAAKLRSKLIKICDECPITVYRIFKELRSTDTSTVNRLGKTIKIPEFWSVFVFEFPDGTDIKGASDGIIELFPSINYSTFNLLGEPNAVPNDPEYWEQASLHSDQFNLWPDGHINVEPAWDYTTGRRDIKIGVFDPNAVKWTHEDFGDGTISTTKVDGWDLVTGTDVYTAPIPQGVNTHGTSVAGIIGAIRNNDIGIAGITGGSYEYGANLDSSGCSIYSMNTTFYQSLLIIDYVADGIVGASIDDPNNNYGYGLHVMNNSWGVSNKLYYGGPNPWYLDTNITLLREAVHFANREQVTVIASRGNEGHTMDTANWYHYNYPGVFDDDWVICVGGTGTDGNYHNMDHTFEYQYKTSRGWEIDVSAASNGAHNWTTHINDAVPYNTFNGTSASAPHAAGTAGLLMSYLNDVGPSYNNLAPEDCEHLMELTALDKDTLILPGKDSLTGYGLIDAGAALQLVDKDIYSLDHYGFSSVPSVFSVSQYAANDTVVLSERFENNAGTWFVQNTPYVVNTWKVDFTCNHNIPSGETIIAYWPRPSSSNTFGLYDANNIVYPREKVEIVSLDHSNAYLRGYLYEAYDTLGNPLGWWPMNFDGPYEVEYTVLRTDTAQTLNIVDENVDHNLNVYPSPTSGEQNVSITLSQPMDAEIRLLDASGRLVELVYEGELNSGNTIFTFDISELSSGIYVYSIKLGEEFKEVKIIKE